MSELRKAAPGGPAPAVAPGVDDPFAVADFALSHRPSLSIRKKIIINFLLCFLAIGGVTLASSLTISRINRKLYFLDVADRYNSEIQQARRYEKNYFLYGTNLPEAIDHVRTARGMFERDEREIASVLGTSRYRGMRAHLDRYEELLGGLRRLDEGAPPGAAPGRHQARVEAELREHGSEMLDVALRVAEAERQKVRRLLRLSGQLPLVFLVVLLGLILYIANFLASQILRPLGRMVESTRRIGRGDFTPLMPVRRYRDEFTELAMAINRMVHELDRRQEMLAEAHKLRAIGTLTAGVAHELNNPVNNISLTVEALLEDHATMSEAERLELFHDLETQAARTHAVVRNLLDFTRQREPHVEDVALGELLGETVRLASSQIKLARVAVALDVAADVPTIRGDRQQLSQVFLNLILNALDAMPGGGTLSVTVRRDDEAPGRVCVEVTDTGTGISDEALPNIFDPFFTTKGAKGTGLGLSVSYGIVTAHGGDLRVRSQVGVGTTFSVHLPREGAAAVRADPPGPPAPAASPAAG